MEKKVTKATYVVKNESVILVGIITEEQAIALIGQPFDNFGSLFGPIQDFYNRWVISEIEVTYNTNPEFPWVNGLELTEYVPKAEIPWW